MRANVYCGNLLWQSSLTLPAPRKNRSEIEKGVLFSSRCACAKEVVPNWDKDKSCDENISGHEDAVARRIKTEFDALYSSCVHRVGKPSVLAK